MSLFCLRMQSSGSSRPLGPFCCFTNPFYRLHGTILQSHSVSNRDVRYFIDRAVFLPLASRYSMIIDPAELIRRNARMADSSIDAVVTVVILHILAWRAPHILALPRGIAPSRLLTMLWRLNCEWRITTEVIRSSNDNSRGLRCRRSESTQNHAFQAYKEQTDRWRIVGWLWSWLLLLN